MTQAQTRAETLGPANILINTLLTHADHLYHGRPGIVVPDRTSPTGVSWSAATFKMEGGVKNAYKLALTGKPEFFGIIQANGDIVGTNGAVRGTYRQPGLFPEVAEYLYRQILTLYKLDQEFVARWASYAFGETHRDLKVVLAAFLLVQSRKGDSIRDEAGKVLFRDTDFRDVGEAMLLLLKKGCDFNPKMLLRVGDLLSLPVIAQINREAGFSNSRKPFLGRWPSVVEKYLLHRENNPKMLQGLVGKAGFRTTIQELAQRVGYKPQSAAFFEVLRWKQKQAADGRRTIAIGAEVAAAETWTGLTEAQICEKIVANRPGWKRIVGMLPSSVGVTSAIVVAALESGALSDQDLIILTPTLEELGLTDVEPVKSRWTAALAAAENQRAANIARRVQTTEVKQALENAATAVVTKTTEKALRGLRLYVIVDISGSMQTAIAEAKNCISKLLGGIPLNKLHVSVFNTTARVVEIKHASPQGVAAAFQGISAGGGTDYGSGVRALAGFKPAADEDVLMLFVGDEDQYGTFDGAVTQSGLNPVAFGLLKVGSTPYAHIVRETAARLGIPCFMIDMNIFSDPYAIPRTLQNLIESTPVGKSTPTAAPRVNLVDVILNTPLLVKPVWAS
jgi:hypothetical protein